MRIFFKYLLFFQAKVMSLIQSLGIKCDIPLTLRSINKYSSRKYVDFRRQAKSYVRTVYKIYKQEN